MATTTSKGKETVSQTVARAKSMLAQTKAEGNKPYKGSSYQISLDRLQPTMVADVPPPPQPKDPGTVSLVPDVMAGLSVKDNQYVYDPKISETQNAVNETNQQQGFNLQSVLNYIGQPQSKEPVLAQLEKDAKIKQKEREVNQYTSNLNQIVAKQQQDLLSLRGTGSANGVTEAVYGGQQAQINREAAIAALPVQAALSAAQGNLDLAQKQVDRLFAIKSEDINAQYKYKQDMGMAVLNFANEAQTRTLTAKLADIKEKKDKELSDLEFERQIYLKNLTGGGGDGAPKIYDIGGVPSVWNPTTNTFDPAPTSAGNGTNLKPIKDAEIRDLSETWTAKNSAISLVEQLQENIRKTGTQALFGKASGERSGARTNLLLAMKNLEKTGALDKGTIDVLEGTIPSSKFFATESAQIAALQTIKDTIESKVNEYVGSYRGTSAELDPRTKRIYGNDVEWTPLAPGSTGTLSSGITYTIE